MEKILRSTEKIIPKKLYRAGQPVYHILIALFSAIAYRSPSRKIKIIAITGTKGKSSTGELVSAILEKAGYKTALSNTIRFKIGEESRPNLYKMSMPGRGFMQKFIHNAVNAKCDYAVIEMTSQGALLYRHRFIHIDTLIVTNISPEHIEAHGSYENYIASKMEIGKQFQRSRKNNKMLIVNSDDVEAKRFLSIRADKKIAYRLAETKPYSLLENGSEFCYEHVRIQSRLSGIFNIYNMLAAIKATESRGIDLEKIVTALRNFTVIRGRMEYVKAGQDFNVIVDYAHTIDSLTKVYEALTTTHANHKAGITNTGKKTKTKNAAENSASKLIGVLGGTGGGRDRWKRKDMGAVADKFCDYVVLTNEDPYDEDPMQIINDVAEGFSKNKPMIILDRRLAIRDAIAHAKTGDTIIITGKGTDPFIMGPNGNNTPWSDAEIARDEIRKLLAKK
jgi:UDP-N-acetylmuramoyl-L-alanyl-D-glutamate--2,6-diaminopimelate ligase